MDPMNVCMIDSGILLNKSKTHQNTVSWKAKVCKHKTKQQQSKRGELDSDKSRPLLLAKMPKDVSLVQMSQV